MSQYDGESEPVRYELDLDDPRTFLVRNVRKALRALPMYFTSPIVIEGVEATDLFAMNTLLGGAIEVQTVSTLNSLRGIWDPEHQWDDKEFKRFPESFPDVRLVGNGRGEEPVIGIELKGWYLLSKEKMPSFRFKASADAVTEWDLLVCVPWTLSNVLSGRPVTHNPFIEQAKYAADRRTYYWKHRQGTSQSRNNEIKFADVKPPRATVSDEAASDSGSNFGRIARIPDLMGEWISESLKVPVSGIEVRYWIEFLKMFTEGRDESGLGKKLAAIANSVRGERQDNVVPAEGALMDYVQKALELYKDLSA